MGVGWEGHSQPATDRPRYTACWDRREDLQLRLDMFIFEEGGGWVAGSGLMVAFESPLWKLSMEPSVCERERRC